MLTRLNFLLGLGLLILIVFYLVGTYIVVGPLSQLAPDWARFAAGAVVLIAVGLTVQFLANTMSSMSGVASYGAEARPGPASFMSQAALVLGHLGMLAMLYGLLANDRPAPIVEIGVIAALYLTGVVIAVGEWRRRRAA